MSEYNGVQGTTSDGKKLDNYLANQQAKQINDDALAIINDSLVFVPSEESMRDIAIVRAAIESSEKEKRITL